MGGGEGGGGGGVGRGGACGAGVRMGGGVSPVGAEPELSLASILGDDFGLACGSTLGEGAQREEGGEGEEAMAMIEVGSGAEVAVESVGISAEDVMALIDST